MTTDTPSIHHNRIQQHTATLRQLFDDLTSGQLYPDDLDDELRIGLVALLATPSQTQKGHPSMQRVVYVVTAPEAIRGIYDNWPQCEIVVKGVQGAQFQKVSSRAEAEALLSGEGVILPTGVYAFVDGNSAGGIGVVCVKRFPDGRTTTREISTTVHEILAPRVDLQTISDALTRFRNVLAELTACYHALTIIHPHTTVTIVHDYLGIARWVTGTWNMPANRLLVDLRDACCELIRAKSLTVQFLHQPGHRSSWAGRHDYATFNTKADTLATQAVTPPAA